MKNVMRTLLIVAMAISVANCSSDGGGGGGSGKGKTAKAPERQECLYDIQRGYYRDENGDRCDHQDYYNEKACYNYYFETHTPYTRGNNKYGGSEWEGYNGYYVDRDGDFVDCDLEYLDFQNFLPYYYFNTVTNSWGSGCSFWGTGLTAVPMGYGGYVCVYYQASYSHPVTYPASWFPVHTGGTYSNGGNATLGDFVVGVGVGALLYHILK